MLGGGGAVFGGVVFGGRGVEFGAGGGVDSA